MSCIRVRTTVQRGGGIAAGVQTFGGVSASAGQGGISAKVDDVANLSAEMIAGGSVSAYLVCEAGREPYLRVKPVETMWVTMENSIDYNVLSNTDWNLR